MYLDFGQRDFAKRIVCAQCGMLFVHGLEEDRRQHHRICRDYQYGVPFQFDISTNASVRVVYRHQRQGHGNDTTEGVIVEVGIDVQVLH
jgi:zinc-finger of acetyl-transferase ESCO